MASPQHHQRAPTADLINDGPADEGSADVRVSFIDVSDPSSADVVALHYSYYFVAREL